MKKSVRSPRLHASSGGLFRFTTECNTTSMAPEPLTHVLFLAAVWFEAVTVFRWMTLWPIEPLGSVFLVFFFFGGGGLSQYEGTYASSSSVVLVPRFDGTSCKSSLFKLTSTAWILVATQTIIKMLLQTKCFEKVIIDVCVRLCMVWLV